MVKIIIITTAMSWVNHRKNYGYVKIIIIRLFENDCKFEVTNCLNLFPILG